MAPKKEEVVSKCARFGRVRNNLKASGRYRMRRRLINPSLIARLGRISIVIGLIDIEWSHPAWLNCAWRRWVMYRTQLLTHVILILRCSDGYRGPS